MKVDKPGPVLVFVNLGANERIEASRENLHKQFNMQVEYGYRPIVGPCVVFIFGLGLRTMEPP